MALWDSPFSWFWLKIANKEINILLTSYSDENFLVFLQNVWQVSVQSDSGQYILDLVLSRWSFIIKTLSLSPLMTDDG